MEREFPVVLQELEQIQNWLLNWGAAQSLSDAVSHRLTLVAEELFVNLVTHGNPGEGSRVRLAVHATGDDVCLEMVDSGDPFDPFASQDPPPDRAMLGLGGLGLYLIRNLAKKTEYVRQPGENRTRVWLAREE